MKRIILALVPAFMFAACGNADNNQAHDHDHDHDHAHENAGATVANADTDPVCGMQRTDKWSEYSVNGTDTVWFCSPVCKERYDADPAQFSPNL
ncbi:MAG TPA: hypothetical protein VKZ76_05915 [Edaphocola sp.]|nr:hypothetical protein [Edaphocola sp.]